LSSTGFITGDRCKRRELFARRERNPADGVLAAISDETGWVAGVDQSLEAGAVGPGVEETSGSAAAVGHAPAIARNRAASRAEKPFPDPATDPA
jgi:hypothetical protein